MEAGEELSPSNPLWLPLLFGSLRSPRVDVVRAIVGSVGRGADQNVASAFLFCLRLTAEVADIAVEMAKILLDGGAD